MSNKPHQKKDKEDIPPYQRENLIKLQAWVDRDIRVRFSGGRQITGLLKGFDNSNNMIVDDTIEYIRDINDHYKLTGETRTLGLIFLRGTMILTIGLADGMEEIENPFAEAE